MSVLIPDAGFHICPHCRQELVEGAGAAGWNLCVDCAVIAGLRGAANQIERLELKLDYAERKLARATRERRRAIVSLIVGPGLGALGILALPYFFRAVLFLERVIGGGR